jgi:hypothetical protein
MKPVWIGSLVAGSIVVGIVAACVAFVVILFLVKALWAWTVPDLFPGAVDQGLITRSISWLAAVKIALCVAVLSGLIGARSRHG